MNIRFENVCFAYENFGSKKPSGVLRQYKPLLQNLSFAIHRGEMVGIVGRSGSGKTTLMQLFNGLLIPDRGRITIDEQDIHALDYDLTMLRRRLGVVFQFPEMHLFAASVEEEISFAPRQQNLAAREIATRVTESLQLAGLNNTFAGRNPFTLSQGEKRRVALAGVLAMQPEVLVLDEPTASLDARGAAEVHGLLRSWHTGGKTIVLISHDMDLIASLCPRLLMLEQGRLLYDGPTTLLWSTPADTTASSSDAESQLLQQAGLPLPRSHRLRRHLVRKSINWNGPASDAVDFYFERADATKNAGEQKT